MPETRIEDKYIDQIPRFTLPEELTNKELEVTAEVVPEVKDEPKPVVEAPTTPTEEVKPEGEATGTDLGKAATSRFERRMDRAVRAKAEALARADALERELKDLKEKQVITPAPGAPRMEDFTDIQEYAKAYATYETGRALKDREEVERTQQSQRMQNQLVSNWEEKSNKVAVKYDDFDEVVGELKPITPWSIAIMQADNGADIAYYLGSHIKEAERIIALDPVSQIREIGKLELKLSLGPEAPKKPSQAPKPIEPVTATATTTGDELEPVMDYERYRKIGNKMFRGNR